MAYCGKCGAYCDDENKFCGRCGAPLNAQGGADESAADGEPSQADAGWTGAGYAPAQRPADGLSVAGLVLGILALVFFWTVGFSLLLSVLGLIFSAISKHKGHRYATAGLVLSIIALILSLALTVGCVTSCTQQAAELGREWHDGWEYYYEFYLLPGRSRLRI